jgi:hypothetical protein
MRTLNIFILKKGKMMGLSFRIIWILLILSWIIGSSSGQTVVEVYDHYNVSITLDKDKAHIKETITIKNVISKSIVPGYVDKTLIRSSQNKLLFIPLPGKKDCSIDVENVVVSFGTSRITDVQVTQTDKSTTIRYGLWFPISPGESQTVVLEYDYLDFADPGILFTQGYYPMAANIPINNAHIDLDLPTGSHVTYSNARKSTSQDLISWSKESLGTDPWLLKFEYSSIPLPTSPIRWSLLLWIFILATAVVWSYRHWKPEK